MEEPEQKKLKDLKLDPRNPRTISKHDVEALKRSLQKFGDLSGVVKNLTTGVLVGGHQRVRQFETMDNPTIEISERLDAPNSVGTVARGYVVIGDEKFAYREVQWDEHTQHAANIAANRIQGEFQIDQLAELTYELSQFDPDLASLTGQTKKEIDDLLDMVGAKPNDEDDDVPPLVDNEPPKSALGQTYRLGPHTLICGDAKTDVPKIVGNDRVSVAFTSPPYNAGDSEELSGNTHTTDNKYPDGYQDTNPDYLQLLTASTDAQLDVADYAFVNLQQLAGNKGDIIDFQAYYRDKLCDVMIWNKENGAPAMAEKVLNSAFEYIFILTSKDKATRAIGSKLFRGTLSNVYTAPPQRNNENAEVHAATFPIHLPRHIISNFTNRGDKVLDVFGGTGTTLIAADELDRVCYMIELDPRYCDVIRKRYAKRHDQEADWETFTPAIV